MVYYNNLLSIPPILVAMWYFGEFEGLLDEPALRNPNFLFVSAMGGIIGFGIRCAGVYNRSTCTRQGRAMRLSSFTDGVGRWRILGEARTFAHALLVEGADKGQVLVSDASVRTACRLHECTSSQQLPEQRTPPLPRP